MGTNNNEIIDCVDELSIFVEAHNLKVTGSNPVPATKDTEIPAALAAGVSRFGNLCNGFCFDSVEHRAWFAMQGGFPFGAVRPVHSGEILADKHWDNPACHPEAPVRFNWHALRHFAISCWIEADLKPKTVQTFAGHSSLTMDRYGHLFKSDDHKKAMDMIANEMLC